MSSRRARKEARDPPPIKFAQPDRSGPDPSQETLFDIAAKRGLLGDPEAEVEEVLVGRVAESILWCISLAMLHFTLDVLVQHQYAEEFVWSGMAQRTVQAFFVFFLLFYSFHRHPEPSLVLPDIFPEWLPLLHQLLFFTGSIAAGCYLIYMTNEHGYYAIMKKAPGIGCLWIWSVIELELKWALPSLLTCLVFFKVGGYSY